MSEGDHESWDEEMMINENHDNPMPPVIKKFINFYF